MYLPLTYLFGSWPGWVRDRLSPDIVLAIIPCRFHLVPLRTSEPKSAWMRASKQRDMSDLQEVFTPSMYDFGWSVQPQGLFSIV